MNKAHINIQTTYMVKQYYDICTVKLKLYSFRINMTLIFSYLCTKFWSFVTSAWEDCVFFCNSSSSFSDDSSLAVLVTLSSLTTLNSFSTVIILASVNKKDKAIHKPTYIQILQSTVPLPQQYNLIKMLMQTETDGRVVCVCEKDRQRQPVY